MGFRAGPGTAAGACTEAETDWTVKSTVERRRHSAISGRRHSASRGMSCESGKLPVRFRSWRHAR
jgi:hypothetical protein